MTFAVIALALPVATAEAQRRAIDYTSFSHSTHVTKQKLGCDSCHKFPTKNWKEVRKGDAAFPDVAEYPEHGTCINCHRQQFFARQRPAPVICSNCHINVTPRDTMRFLFPSLGDVANGGRPRKENVREFKVEFPHKKHEDQECITCHQLDEKKSVKTNPNSHTVCFSCHNVETELPPAPSTCNACHKLESASTTSAASTSRLNAVSTTLDSQFSDSAEGAEYESQGQARREAERVAPGNDKREEMRPEGPKYQRYYAPSGLQASFDVLIQGRRAPLRFALAPGFQMSRRWRSDQQKTMPNDADYSQFKHDDRNHARLPCLLCHRRENNSPQPTLPGKAAHAPCTGCHAQQFSNPASEICTICHTDAQNGKVKAFPPLRSFDAKFDHATHASAACATCHKRNRGGVALSIPSRSNAHVTCFACHTPNAQANGRNISSCSTCHQLGRLVRTSEQATAYRVGFSHVDHDASEKLACAACHQVRAGLPRGRQVSAPLPLNHHAPSGASSCATCHNGKRTFGGDDFSACKRCHKGSAWHF